MNNELNKENLKALVELGEVLRSIHKRLIREGYVIMDGEVYKLSEKPIISKGDLSS